MDIISGERIGDAIEDATPIKGFTVSDGMDRTYAILETSIDFSIFDAVLEIEDSMK